ncbi:nucleotidyltransferase domain-containing protein [Natronoglomus mannanivorans]|uniref:Nucleotidyltransferase domain-containing protein n=1 Tax=Natronoglomus mannanivorans TaxID=2979990 RepID=A0AAP2Z2L7_9EURY|nr:nucleotidyltransferase domain-containing protein [Halobacteria archaeon AArc-xg1-1]
MIVTEGREIYMIATHNGSRMSNREHVSAPSSTNAHAVAAEEFADRARSRFEHEIVQLYVFGSTIRGETRGLSSDVDVLVVLDETANHEAIGEVLRDLAYDIMLEYGPVVELHVLSEHEFEQSLDRGNPFLQNVVQEGRSYAC